MCHHLRSMEKVRERQADSLKPWTKIGSVLETHKFVFFTPFDNLSRSRWLEPYRMKN
jgi:hypothetical protein